MVDCDHCGGDAGVLPYECSYCSAELCTDHRQPEHHDCPHLDDAGTWFEKNKSSAAHRKSVHDAGGADADSRRVGKRNVNSRPGIINVDGDEDATGVGEDDDEDEDDEESDDDRAASIDVTPAEDLEEDEDEDDDA